MQVRCSACGAPFEARRSTARFCGATCRQRSGRRLKSADDAPETPNPDPVQLPETAPDGLVIAVKAELDAADRLNTPLGQQALRLAQRMGSQFDTGSAIAALSRELRATLTEALRDATKAADGIDELAARRIQRASGA